MSAYLPVGTVEHRDFCAAPAVTVMHYKDGDKAVCQDCGASAKVVTEQRGGVCHDCGGRTADKAFYRCARCHLKKQQGRAEAIERKVARATQVVVDLAARSRYRCRDHPDHAVRRTARGYAKGCAKCAQLNVTTRQEEEAK